MTERLGLAARLDLSASEALLEQLSELRGRDLSIYCAGVTHLGAHAAQTLLVARKSWAGDGRELTFEAPSASFLSGWEELGLAQDLLSDGGLVR